MGQRHKVWGWTACTDAHTSCHDSHVLQDNAPGSSYMSCALVQVRWPLYTPQTAPQTVPHHAHATKQGILQCKQLKIDNSISTTTDTQGCTHATETTVPRSGRVSFSAVYNVPKAVGCNSPNDPVHIPLEHHPRLPQPSTLTHTHTLPPHSTTTGWCPQGVGAVRQECTRLHLASVLLPETQTSPSPALTASLEISMVTTSRLLVQQPPWHWVKTVPDRVLQGNTLLTTL